jgi:hypothetical protein
MPLKSHELIYVFAKKSAFYKRIDEVKEGMPSKFRKPSNPRKNNLLGHTKDWSNLTTFRRKISDASYQSFTTVWLKKTAPNGEKHFHL